MSRKNNINFVYNSEVKKCKTIDDILEKNDQFKSQLKMYYKIYLKQKWINILVEININVKVIFSLNKETIEVDLDILRDRNAEFEPQIIKK